MSLWDFEQLKMTPEDIERVQRAKFQEIEPGTYMATITDSKTIPIAEQRDLPESEHKDFHLKVEFTLMGKLKGRRIYKTFAFGSSNETAKRIAAEQLNLLLSAIRVTWDKDNVRCIVGKPCRIVVTKGREWKGRTYPEVSAFLVAEAPAPPPVAPPAPTEETAKPEGFPQTAARQKTLENLPDDECPF